LGSLNDKSFLIFSVENKSSIRTARSAKFAVNDEIFYIKMIRNGPENFMVQREVIQIEKNIWRPRVLR
jgi:hypothetical protein